MKTEHSEVEGDKLELDINFFLIDKVWDSQIVIEGKKTIKTQTLLNS